MQVVVGQHAILAPTFPRKNGRKHEGRGTGTEGKQERGGKGAKGGKGNGEDGKVEVEQERKGGLFWGGAKIYHKSMTSLSWQRLMMCRSQ